eukprot:3277519-Alexandrium_andersonii.AAC.1
MAAPGGRPRRRQGPFGDASGLHRWRDAWWPLPAGAAAAPLCPSRPASTPSGQSLPGKIPRALAGRPFPA